MSVFIRNLPTSLSGTFCKFEERRIKSRLRTTKTIEELVDFVFSFKFIQPLPIRMPFKFLSIVPEQIRGELIQLLKTVHELRPKFVMEVGTLRGGTLLLFCTVADSDASIISIDFPGKKIGEAYAYPPWKTRLYKSFAGGSQSVHPVIADSHDHRTFGKVEELLGGNELDFLFIDGDHSYNGVKKDFKMYSPLVRKGGLIAFHDIVPGSSRTSVRYGGEVPSFWKEISQEFKHTEIVESWEQGRCGIGIIYM